MVEDDEDNTDRRYDLEPISYILPADYPTDVRIEDEIKAQTGKQAW